MAAFNKKEFLIMALGNIIGSGIFLASGTVIAVAGPWAPAAYLLGGLIMAMEVSFIIEMSIAHPVPGAFKAQAQEIFGEWWGFVNGWMFWTSGMLGMSSEITACALYTHLWLPNVPLWALSLLFAVAITVINLNDLKGLSKIELILAITKVMALVVFIAAGFFILLGVPVGGAAGNLSAFHSIPALPGYGTAGLLGSMLMILFAYTGTGIIGLAATETDQAAHTVPQATRIVIISVIVLYTMSVFLMLALLPAGALQPDTSPFIALFTVFNIPYATAAVNFILLSAALSSLNSQVYSASRMLFSLGKSKQAPLIVSRQNKKGVPVAAVMLSGIVLLLTALASYYIPETLYINAVCASSFLALVNWMSVSATHYFFRKKFLAENPEKLQYKAPFYPWLSGLCFFAVLMTILSAPLYPGQLPGLYMGGIILAVIGAAYFMLPAKYRKP